MHSLAARLTGFIGSLLLTLMAFWIIANPDFFHLTVKGAINAILVLALLQAAVQSVFFLNILGEKGPRWNLVAFGSTIATIIIIVAFSIWIMHHLNYNMMP